MPVPVMTYWLFWSFCVASFFLTFEQTYARVVGRHKFLPSASGRSIADRHDQFTLDEALMSISYVTSDVRANFAR